MLQRDLPFLPPGAHPATGFGGREPQDRPPAPLDLPRGGLLEVVCAQPVHHVLELSSLYRLLTALAHQAPERPVRLWLGSALEDWEPLRRLPAERIERLPALAEEALSEDRLDALSEGSVLLLTASGEWEARLPGAWEARLRERLAPDRLRVLPLEARWQPEAGADHDAACARFFGAVVRESPRWRPVSPGARPIRLPPAPRILLHQSRFHVGDALWITPLLRSLKRLLPGCRTTLVGPPAAAPVLAADPHLDRLLAWSPGGGGRDETAKALAAGGGFDAALFAFCRREESRWMVDLAVGMGIPHRVNLEYFDPALDWRRLGPGLTSEAWSFWGALPSPQQLLQAAAPFAAAGSLRPEDHRVELSVPAAARRRAAAILGRAGVGREPFAVLSPGGLSSRRWPARRFGRLARWLTDELRLHVLIEGSREERGLLERVAAVAPGRASGRRILVRTDPLLDLAALLERAVLLVANDSAPIHLAEAAGTPTLYFAHQEKLVHSHPASPVCRALYEPLRNDPSRITVVQASGAVRSMRESGLLVRRSAPPGRRAHGLWKE